MLSKLLWFYACFLPLPVFAAIVDVLPVQVGVFEKENCVSESKYHNSCLCSASVYKAVVSGISYKAAEKINAVLPRLDETSDDLCEGRKVNVNEKNTTAYRSLDFKDVFNKAPFLTIRQGHSGYYEGAPHPFNDVGYYFFNTKTGNEYTYRDLFGDNLKALNNAIEVYLEAHKRDMDDMGEHNGEEVFYNVKESLENGWIDADSIDDKTGNIYLSGKGLIYVFNGGWHIASDIEVVLPTNIIKDKEVRKYVRSLNAS